VVFQLWIPELRNELLEKYHQVLTNKELYIPLFLDLIIKPIPSTTEDLTNCVNCLYDYDISLCNLRNNKDPFLNVTMALSTPTDQIINAVINKQKDKNEMYIPSNIQIRKAGSAGLFCDEFHTLSGTLKAQLLPIGSDSWFGILKSFGDLNNPSPLFSRFKVR
jgi:hypothetical protein